MRRVIAIAALVLVVGAAMAAERERPLYDERFFVPVAEVVTPHIAWAKPYYAPPKVLFITHRNAMREVIELAQRVEMDYRVFAMDGPGAFGETGIGVDASWRLVRGNSYEELAERLRGDLARDYDVIVLGAINWDALPLDCRYEILKKVKAGTGLVGVARTRDAYLDEILKTASFGWNWATWSGAAQGVADYFGTGVYEGSVDYTGGHTGTAALRVECKSVTKGSREASRAGYYPGIIKLEPNTEYVFSVWAKTQGLKDGDVTVSLHPQPAGGVAIPASAEWKLTEKKFKTNDTVTTTGVYMLIYQPGVVWFDDAKLVKVGDGRAQGSAPTNDTANLLPNGSFEYPGPAPVELSQGLPQRMLPAFAKQPDAASFLRSIVTATTFRDGRIGLLNLSPPGHQMLTPGPTEAVQYCRQDYDYYLQLATRLILWGAKKSPQVAVAANEPVAGTVGMTQVPVKLVAGAACPKATLVTDVRDQYGRQVGGGKQAVDLRAGENEVAVALPAVGAGDCFVNLLVQSAGKTVGFGTVGLQLGAPTRVKELTLGQDSFALKEPLRGKLVLEGPTAGLQVRLTARDGYGRLVAERTVPVTGNEMAFEVPVQPMLTIVGWLEAEVVQGKQILEARQVDFTINNRMSPRDDVQFVMWQGYPNDFVAPMMAEEFTRNGIDSFYDGGSIGYGPYANQRWLPYATRFVDTKTDWYQERPTREKGDLVRSPCLTDPVYRAKVRDDLTKVAQRGLKYGASDFTLGDENHFVAGNWDLCFSETCNADFQRWARESYGTLEKLNAEWGSNFSNWNEVKPQTLEEAKKTGNLVPWVDHRLHMDSVWAGIHDYSRGIIKETVPHARVGYEGSDITASTWQATDYWKLSQAMDLNNIYYKDFLSVAMVDFAPKGMLLGAGWFGGYPGNRNEEFMRWFPWRTLFKGSNSFWVWCGQGNPGSVMSYDVSLYPFFQKACEEVGRIKAGPGKLLMNAERQHDGVALLWSAASMHVGTATPGLPSMDNALSSMVMVLHDCGLEAKVLSYAELAAGKLNNKDFKVLLLPQSLALSEAEIAAVRKFAEGGGTVVADLRPGVTDEHGKPYAAPAPQELFGVQYAEAFKAGNGDLTIGGGSLKGVICDAGVKASGGAAKIGETPAVISNAVGKGKAILLNFSLKGYLSPLKQEGAEFAGWNQGAPYREFFGGLLKAAGVAPQVTVTPEAPRVEVSRFAQGGAEYVGIIQGLPLDPLYYTNHPEAQLQARAVTIKLPQKRHVYEVRSGKYLGETATVGTKLTPGIAQLYALLPYKLDSVAVQAPAAVKAGEELRYAAKLGTKGQAAEHVLRVQVFGPDGKERPWYAANVVSEGGTAAGKVQLALDEAAGAWKIVATDVATGVRGTAGVKVLGISE
ncbi:MAG: beta-galactosidase [Armatimonadia bacterium]